MGLIYYITQVQFDFGAIALARAECERAGIRRPLVCTDRGVVAAGLLERLESALGDLPVAVFDRTPWLCAYCPVSNVARAGQHNGKGE